MIKYGTCEKCDVSLEPTEWFKEKEYVKGVPTGRYRMALSSIVCPVCLKEHVIDDSFDSAWRI